MQSTELEMRVLASIKALAEHGLGEDDLVEFKRDWPDADKDKFVRQLAGSLNRAGGETVILVIGIDEKAGTHFPWTGVDLNNWWPSVKKQFDHAVPEMVRDLTIQIQGGKTVHALAISSDQAPYVLRTSNGSSTREIPIREGTGTRSASRDELLRMLVPTLNVPKIDVLGAGVTFVEDYGDPNPDAGDDGGVFFSGWVNIFVEHTFSRSSVMFPRHRISGALHAAGLTTPIVSPSRGVPEQKLPFDLQGVIERPDGFIVNGPGTMRVRFQSSRVDWDAYEQTPTEPSLQLTIDLPVSGTNRSVHVNQMLQRNDATLGYRGGSTVPLAQWSYTS